MPPRYSIVIPIYNEEDTIEELWTRVSQATQGIAGDWEVIFVDDGSRDGSLRLLTHLQTLHPTIKILALSRNFGHQPALTAGIDRAEGDAVILMDGDLQDLPEAIPDFLKKWKEGFEVVFAIRTKRKENFLKRTAFGLFYLLQTKLSDVSTPPDAGIFSLLDRKVILALRSMTERNRYLSGLRAYTGFRQTGLHVERGERFSGEPRVSLARLIKLALDGIFSFSTVPLRMISILGVSFSVTSFLVGCVGLFYKYILHREFLSWGYGLTTAFFLGGVQLLSLGILGEYLGRIYEEVKQRPHYIIGQELGFPDSKNMPANIPNR